MIKMNFITCLYFDFIFIYFIFIREKFGKIMNNALIDLWANINVKNYISLKQRHQQFVVSDVYLRTDVCNKWLARLINSARQESLPFSLTFPRKLLRLLRRSPKHSRVLMHNSWLGRYNGRAEYSGDREINETSVSTPGNIVPKSRGLMYSRWITMKRASRETVDGRHHDDNDDDDDDDDAQLVTSLVYRMSLHENASDG